MAPGAAQPAQQAWRGGEVSPEQLKELLREGSVALLDVRDDEEVEAWPLPGAAHVPMDRLPSAPRAVPGDKPVVAVCARGHRSAKAASWLAQRGFEAASLQGGMEALGRTYDASVTPVQGGHLLQLRRLGKGCLTYVLASGGEALVVDPTCHLEAVTGLVRERGLDVARVLDTHRHADHLSGAAELARATGARLGLSAGDDYAPDGFEPIRGGMQFSVGHRSALTVDAVATPGHTPGSLTFLVEGRAALTGDALFLDGVGRPDLRDDAAAQARDLHATYLRIAGWDPRLLLFPAHLSARWPLRIGEPATRTLGEVAEALGVFRLGQAEFVERVLARLPEKPANYRRILDLNRRGGGCDPALVEELETGPNRCVGG